MADTAIAAIRDAHPSSQVTDLYLTDRLPDMGPIDGVMFSGGVGEYVYGRETRDFGDLGRRFGEALRRKIDAGAMPWPLLPAKECIRATALGASEYSVQLSGNTIYISNHAALLPRRNLQVVKPSYVFQEVVDSDEVAKAIRDHLTKFDLQGEETEVALAFEWLGMPSYERVAAFARGIVAGLPRTIAAGKPLYLVLDGDLAQTLGGVLREDLGVKSEVLVVDGVMLFDFDYVDLGKVRLPSHTVPVTVKSLVFNENAIHDAAKPASHQHDHAHDHGHHHGHGHHHDHHHHDHGSHGHHHGPSDKN
jgi:ethanolamine utilization protein EutA